ncbi:28767_t:CDS:1, partial [Racocetra persica]
GEKKKIMIDICKEKLEKENEKLRKRIEILENNIEKKEKIMIDTREEKLEKENEKLRKRIEILENDIEKKDKNNDKQANYIVTLRNKLKNYKNKIDKLRMTLDNEQRNFRFLQRECDRKERIIKRF